MKTSLSLAQTDIGATPTATLLEILDLAPGEGELSMQEALRTGVNTAVLENEIQVAGILNGLNHLAQEKSPDTLSTIMARKLVICEELLSRMSDESDEEKDKIYYSIASFLCNPTEISKEQKEKIQRRLYEKVNIEILEETSLLMTVTTFSWLNASEKTRYFEKLLSKIDTGRHGKIREVYGRFLSAASEGDEVAILEELNAVVLGI